MQGAGSRVKGERLGAQGLRHEPLSGAVRPAPPGCLRQRRVPTPDGRTLAEWRGIIYVKQMRLTTASLVLMLAVPGCSTAVQRAGQSDTEFVWVCHGNRNPRWQRVAAPAADGHRRHGDRVSTRAQENGAACDNPDQGEIR